MRNFKSTEKKKSKKVRNLKGLGKSRRKLIGAVKKEWKSKGATPFLVTGAVFGNLGLSLGVRRQYLVMLACDFRGQQCWVTGGKQRKVWHAAWGTQ